MNTIFGDMAANLATFDPQLEAVNAARPHHEKIVELNRDDQMYEQGIDADGVKLGQYADSTREKKEAEGQRFDHITLRDTQQFHASMEARFTKRSFEIKADDQKTNDITGEPVFLKEIYGDEILGLTDKNLDFVKHNLILPTLKETFRHRLFANKKTF